MKKFPCFIHIEKAGGITLSNILHQSFQGYITPAPDYGEVFKAKDLKNIQRIYPLRISGVGGHRISAFEKYKSPESILFRFTFMRDPVSRYLSHLNWQIHRMDIGWTIDSFLEDPFYNNFQAFRICGSRDLEKAKETIIQNFDFIGLMEKYDESLLLLRKRLNSEKLNILYEKSNLTTDDNRTYFLQDLSPEHKDKVIANNEIDIELYKFVKEKIFSNYLKTSGQELQDELEAFRRKNENYAFKKKTLIKRKLSNAWLKKIAQPLFQSKVEYGR